MLAEAINISLNGLLKLFPGKNLRGISIPRGDSLFQKEVDPLRTTDSRADLFPSFFVLFTDVDVYSHSIITLKPAVYPQT